MEILINGSIIKKIWQQLTLIKAKYFEKKGGTKIKIKKLLIVRIRNIINPSPNFGARPKKPLKCSKCLQIRPIVEWNTSNFRKKTKMHFV